MGSVSWQPTAILHISTLHADSTSALVPVSWQPIWILHTPCQCLGCVGWQLGYIWICCTSTQPVQEWSSPFKWELPEVWQVYLHNSCHLLLEKLSEPLVSSWLEASPSCATDWHPIRIASVIEIRARHSLPVIACPPVIYSNSVHVWWS